MPNSMIATAGAAAIAGMLAFVLHVTAAWSCPYVAAACFDQPLKRAPSSETRLFAADVHLPATDAATIYLTFDDGPNPDYTPQILDILQRYDARATFFVTGQAASWFPELLARITDEGHTLGNHAWNHENLTQLSTDEIAANLQRTQLALAPHATPCLRPPYFASNDDVRAVAGSLGMSLIFGSLATQDWLRPGADVIAERIVADAYAGSIVVLHDGGGERSQTVKGLAMAMELLAAQGYRFEPVC